MNDEYWALVFRLVPDHGVAETVQGELVRAVLRLTAERSRNGCGNWDDYYEALCAFAAERFADGTLDELLAAQALTMLARLQEYGRATTERTRRLFEELCRSIDGPLENAAVQWCQRHADLIPFFPTADYGAND